MPQEVGIVMTLYDRVSPTLKSIAGNTDAFDKSLDELAEGLKTYDKAQDTLSKRAAELKKALEGANQEVTSARKEYRRLKDETSKGALDDAIDEQTRLKRELTEVEGALRANSRAYDDLYANARKAASGISSVENRAGRGMDSLMTGLARSGLIQQFGDAASQLLGFGLGSFAGQPAATAVSGILSGALSGAAAGAIAGPVGTAIGAAAGGISGALGAAASVGGAADDAFRSYVQEAVEGQQEEMSAALSSGSGIAGQREQDQVAFAQRFGSEEAARDYLEQVRVMAADTNYGYDEIVGYSKNLLNSYSPGETLGVLRDLSDATAGLGLDSSGVSMFIAGLSRMRTTGKVTQEYLNYFSERGLNVYEALSRATGAQESQIADMVTNGDIGGVEAAQAILDYIQEEFGGLSEKLKDTYPALVDNLADVEADLEARMGEGYNETRKAGISDQMEWLQDNGELGEAYEAIGAWRAELENQKEQYIRDAVDAAMGSEDYQTAKAEGDAAEMGRIIMEAKIRGMDEYNASDGAQLLLESERQLIAGVREDAALNNDYWDAGYELGQEFSKGFVASLPYRFSEGMVEDAREDIPTYEEYQAQHGGRSHASGLRRVPYDNYAALLHEGERVLTAREAREMDRQGAGSITVNIGGSWSVRSEEDIDAIAEAIARRVRLAQAAGVRS